MNKTILKNHVRKKLLQKRQNLSKNQKIHQNKRIASFLENLDTFRKAKVIFIYVSLQDEVDTMKIIQKYLKLKIIVVPLTNIREKKIKAGQIHEWDELQPKNYGILEPKSKKAWSWKKIDLAIIPGIAFDRQGNRIGYGKGYYDKVLNSLTCPKIGLAYHFQILPAIFSEVHDIPVDIIITDREIINCKSIKSRIEINTLKEYE